MFHGFVQIFHNVKLLFFTRGFPIGFVQKLEAIVWNLCDASHRRLGLRSTAWWIDFEAKMKKVGHENPVVWYCLIYFICIDILMAYIHIYIIAYNMTIEAYWTYFLRIGLRMKGYRYRQISTGSQPNRCHKLTRDFWNKVRSSTEADHG